MHTRSFSKMPSRSLFLASALVFTAVVYLFLVSNQVHKIRESINRQFRELRSLRSSIIQKPYTLNGDLSLAPENETLSDYKQSKRQVDKSRLPLKIDDFQSDEKKLEWLDRNNAKGYDVLGDGTCPENSKKELFKIVLEKWSKIAQRLQIRYFMDYGALLGAWRDENVIPWDHDIDIRIHVDDFLKLLPVRETRPVWNPNDQDFHVYITTDWRLPHHMRRKFDCQGKTVDHYVDQCSFTLPYARLIKGHVHVDIFVYTTYHDTVKYMPSNGLEFLKGDVFPLVKCNMMGLVVRCPRNPKVILDSLYDDNLLPRDICKNSIYNRNPEYFKRELELKQQKKKQDPYRFV